MSTETNIHVGAEERATRCVSWFIAGNYNNGEASCRQWEDMARNAYEIIRENWLEEDEAERIETQALAQALKDWVEDERGEVNATPFDDMLGYMLACVDWHQLAVDAIEQHRIEDTA